MKIIIVGCGKIGESLIGSLIAEGHDIVAIDKDQTLVDSIVEIHDAMGVCGNGAACDTLIEAGVEKADLFIAVTGSDELNMLSCFVAKKMGASHTIARVRTPGYDQNMGFMRQQLDISLVINPELLAAQEFFNVLKLPSAIKVEMFCRRSFEMIEVKLRPDSPLIGAKLADLRKNYDADFLVSVVMRGDDVFIPGGDFVIQAEDRVCITATPTEIDKLLKMTGALKKQAKSVMLLGASRTGYYLAKKLLDSGTNVKIIEQNPDFAEQISDLLPAADVIQGDGAQQELLLAEGLRQMDAFVSLTGIDEENILLAFYAKSQQVKTVIAKVNRNEFGMLAKELGLESIVSPKKLISDVVISYARAYQNSMGSKVETLYKIMDEKAEALEFKVQPDFRHAGVPLKEMHLKPNILIAGINRGRKAIIPSGDDVILPGDRVVVISSSQRMNDLSDIIK